MNGHSGPWLIYKYAHSLIPLMYVFFFLQAQLLTLVLIVENISTIQTALRNTWPIIVGQRKIYRALTVTTRLLSKVVWKVTFFVNIHQNYNLFPRYFETLWLIVLLNSCICLPKYTYFLSILCFIRWLDFLNLL